MSRYGKRRDLVVHEEEPFNAETGLAALVEGPLTATDAFYVRGHGAVPEIDPAAWRLHVHGAVERELDLSLATLREALREREVTATLQCAGNRRAGLIAIRDIPGGAPWGPGATGTATWTGVALADVLALAGPLREAAHVGFEGADFSEEATPTQRFGGSIPLEKACRPEVLLAWAMNGEPLPLVHGAPLRVVVPGYIGARSVKWLERIEVRSSPLQGYFQHVVSRLVPLRLLLRHPASAHLHRPLRRLRRERHGRRHRQAALYHDGRGRVAAPASAGRHLHQLGHPQAGRQALEPAAQAGLRGGRLRSDSLLVAGEAGGADADDYDSRAGSLAVGAARMDLATEMGQEREGCCSAGRQLMRGRKCGTYTALNRS